MAEHIQQVKTLNNNSVAAQITRTITDDGSEVAQTPTSTAARVLWFVAGVVITLLALRFLFVLLGANQNNGFVDLVYTCTMASLALSSLHWSLSSFMRS
jgi:hypothetical protein